MLGIAGYAGWMRMCRCFPVMVAAGAAAQTVAVAEAQIIKVAVSVELPSYVGNPFASIDDCIAKYAVCGEVTQSSSALTSSAPNNPNGGKTTIPSGFADLVITAPPAAPFRPLFYQNNPPQDRAHSYAAVREVLALSSRLYVRVMDNGWAPMNYGKTYLNIEVDLDYSELSALRSSKKIPISVTCPAPPGDCTASIQIPLPTKNISAIGDQFAALVPFAQADKVLALSEQEYQVRGP